MPKKSKSASSGKASKKRTAGRKKSRKTVDKMKPSRQLASETRALTESEKYEARKERERARQAKQSASGRDIAAEFPECADRQTRKKCDRSLKYFMLEVFPDKFQKDFSPDHETAIKKMEASIVGGLLFALSMPRGSGKTTLIICAVIWAIVTGRRRYVALIGPTARHAKKMLRTIKKAFETNKRLLELYPEAAYPVKRLGRMNNRARGQTYEGESTYIEWTKGHIVLAAIPDAACSGAIIEVAGMTGSIRGMQFDSPEGETLRPDIVVIDDPQTKRSAKSETQCDDRLETIQGDILGLAGPGQSIAGFLMCTVIRKGDVADTLLDQEEYPDWQGDRFQLVYNWPVESAQKHWDQYAILRADDLRSGKKTLPTATKYYKKHRKAMDKGSNVGWADRFDKSKGELSALQHAYNLLLRDEDAFWCEYQNEPRDPYEDTELLTVKELMAKHSGYTRGTVHPQADTLTAFIDVQGKCLYWVVVAWRTDDFSGWIVDYGAWPDQKISAFKLSNVRNTLAKKYPGAGKEGRIKAGLEDCIDYLVGRIFKAPDGAQHRVRRIGVDVAWGDLNTTLVEVCRTHEHAAMVVGCYGRGIKPTQAPMSAWAKVSGEIRGVHWIQRQSKGGGRHLLSDVNFWKTFVHNRFAVASGDKGSLSFPKPKQRNKTEHKMLADHCRAEIRKHEVTDQRRGDVWSLPSEKPDNHLFDCIVHCAVMASVEGVRLVEHAKPRTKKKRRGYSGSLAA